MGGTRGPEQRTGKTWKTIIRERLLDAYVKTCNIWKKPLPKPPPSLYPPSQGVWACKMVWLKLGGNKQRVSHTEDVSLLSAGWTNQRHWVLPCKQHQKSTERQGGVTRKCEKWAKWHVEKMSANYAYFTLTFNASRWWASELSGAGSEGNPLSLGCGHMRL